MLWRGYVILNFRCSYFITTLTYVYMDNICPCLFTFYNMFFFLGLLSALGQLKASPPDLETLR